MSETPSQPPQSVPPPTPGAGCGTVLTLIVGAILLLPGLCSLAFLLGEITQLAKDGTFSLFRDGDVVALWIMGIALSAIGIFLIRATLKARRPQ